MSTTLRVDSSNNMEISDSVVDASGNKVTSGQTTAFKIQRFSDGLWWDGEAFTLASEPAGTLSATQDGATGVYRHILTNGFDGVSLDYTVRHIQTGIVAQDFTTDENPIDKLAGASAVWGALRADHNIAGSFGEYTRASLERIKGLTTVDGLDIDEMFINMISILQGDVARSGNTYTFKKQDGSTTTVSFTISGAGRS